MWLVGEEATRRGTKARVCEATKKEWNRVGELEHSEKGEEF